MKEVFRMAKKIGLMVMAVMLASPYFFKDSNAAQGWYTCTVNMAGPGGGRFLFN